MTTFLASSKNIYDNLQIGERYELLKQLGSGSFSEVCLAEDSSTGEQVNSAPKKKNLAEHCYYQLPYYSKIKESEFSLVLALPHLDTCRQQQKCA